MTRKELLRRLDAAERLDWQVLEEVDPWGQHRDDYRAALLAWIMSGHRNKIEDYLLDFFRTPLPPPPTKKQSQAEQELILRLWVQGSNVSFAEQRIGQA